MFGKTTYFLVFSFSAFLLFGLFTYHAALNYQPEVVAANSPKYLVSGTVENISATAYAIFDLETEEVLVGQQIDQALPIASITKLLTAASLSRTTDLDQTGIILNQDLLAEGQAGKLAFGERYTYRDLLFPLLLESSNDAAAFFERVTDGEVVLEMNKLAAELKLRQTVLADASGLSDKNVSTVTDLITFTQYLDQELPYVLDITQLKQYLGPYSGWVNNNPVIGSDYRGGKHGYTEAAGRTLVAIYNEDFGTVNKRIGYVLLNSDNLISDTAILRDFIKTKVMFE